MSSPRRIEISTELPTSADRVWAAMQHPASFLYVIKGIFGLPALAGRTEPVRAGETGSGWLLLFHVLPIHRHTIHVEAIDGATRTLSTREHGGVLRRWEHDLHVRPLTGTTCRYQDVVTIDGGRLTPVIAALATQFYRYRQRRWHRLVRKHLLPTTPAAPGPSDVTAPDRHPSPTLAASAGAAEDPSWARSPERDDCGPPARPPR